MGMPFLLFNGFETSSWKLTLQFSSSRGNGGPPPSNLCELTARYLTPSQETSQSRRRRVRNRRRALQRFQARRSLDHGTFGASTARNVLHEPEASAESGIEAHQSQLPHTTTTVVLEDRYATPLNENAESRRRRLANRRQAQQRGRAQDAAQLARQNVRNRVRQLAFSASSIQDDQGFPTLHQLASALQNLSGKIPSEDEDGEAFPTFAQLASALRSLSPEVPFDEEGLPGMPTYTQLHYALRNLTPEVPSADVPPRGLPSYAQLAEALRNLSPEVPSSIEVSPGFPSYAQLTDALRNLPDVIPTSVRHSVSCLLWVLRWQRSSRFGLSRDMPYLRWISGVSTVVP
ncbi:hypothetical protein V7S43_003581 [Phytophthora oleae]|uniref:BZIP domain-containing protein n=1 Tax=Phytophthora oleae TaxID=2107226 RepID=A0ABD3FZN2_9STRA